MPMYGGYYVISIQITEKSQNGSVFLYIVFIYKERNVYLCMLNYYLASPFPRVEMECKINWFCTG